MEEITGKEKKGITRFTILKILMAYYGCPCKYREKGSPVWIRGLINGKTIANFETHETVLHLKPLYKITAKEVAYAHQLMQEEGEDAEEPDLSEQGVKDFREHLQDNPELAPYVVVEYLRREGFHFPMYGIDLFKANIAHVFAAQGYKAEPTNKG